MRQGQVVDVLEVAHTIAPFREYQSREHWDSASWVTSIASLEPA
jgi:hypothetical protein